MAYWFAYRLDCRLAHEAIGTLSVTGMASYYFGTATQGATSLQAIGTCCEPTVSNGVSHGPMTGQCPTDQ